MSSDYSNTAESFLEQQLIMPPVGNYNRNPTIDPQKPLKILSLFSGCGGMDLGFEGGFKVPVCCINPKLSKHLIERRHKNGFITVKQTKFSVVFANDILPAAHKTWTANFCSRNKDPNIFHTGSIVDLVKKHESGIPIFPRNIEVVIGGFPCQDFSVSGKRGGLKSHRDHRGNLLRSKAPSIESRGQLYLWMKKVIEITQPNIFVAENVRGLVNLANVRDIIQSDFSSANNGDYLVLPPKILHAADFGVPQSRERVIFIGVKRSALKKKAAEQLALSCLSKEYDPYPEPTYSYSSSGLNLAAPVTLGQMFEGVPEPSDSQDISHRYYSRAKYMGSHCQGQSEIKLNNIGPTIRAEHHGNIEFRRLSKQNGGRLLDELGRGFVERRLTPRECALIQTFPPDFTFVTPSSTTRQRFYISPSEAYKVIGNAVPPLLAYHLAKRLEEIWDLFFYKKR